MIIFDIIFQHMFEMKDFGSSKNTVRTAVMFLCELCCRAILYAQDYTQASIQSSHKKREKVSKQS